jgi:very-short-patch-repair endonuclease
MKGAKDRSWRVSQPVVDKCANRDELIAAIASKQHGVIDASQLRSAGLTRAAIAKRAGAGRLHRLHRGVYAVGHRNVSFEGRCMAVVLACGECSVVSHRSAAVLWGMLAGGQASIDVTLSSDGGRRKQQGIVIHRSRTLTARIITRRSGIPVTNPARTLRDLRRTVPQPVFRRALRRALDLRLIRSTGVAEPDLTRSELERLFLRLCDRHRFPQPEVNARIGGHEVDFLWRSQGLIVETDGFRHHGDRAAFESDRARDATLQARGYRVVRFTYRQVKDHREVAETLRTLLGPAALFKQERRRPLAPDLR